MAAFWLTVTTLILVGTYLSLPFVANETLSALRGNVGPSELKTSTTRPTDDPRSPHTEPYTIGVLALGLFAVCFACFLLGRAAFVEIELAARFAAFADALCLAGENFDQLEKAASLMLPGSKYLSVPEIFSTKDLDSIAEVLKTLRPK